MCFSQYAQYAPRPVVQDQHYEYEAPARPEGAPPTKADLDDNLFGPKPMPPEWQQKRASHSAVMDQNNGHSHTHNGHSAPTAVAHQETAVGGLNASVAAIVVELTNGTKLRISISQE